MEGGVMMEWFRNLPIGQYVPGNSFVHRLDPRTKIIFVFIYVIFIFIVNDTTTLSVYGGVTIIAIALSKISSAYLWRALRGMMLMITLIGLLQLFLIQQGELIWSWSWISIYSDGIERAIFVSLRLFFLIVITSLLTLTTSPILLTDGLERLLKPLSKVGVPVHELALMMSIAIRYIPTLMEETDKIIKAQTARGADFESGNLIKRVKALFPLLVPLFVSSFRRAEDLALAMEARCYRGGVGRTRRKGNRPTWRDGIAGGVILMLTIITFAL
jgi:energy-coupling factor transport system permease protein